MGGAFRRREAGVFNPRIRRTGDGRFSRGGVSRRQHALATHARGS